MRSRRVSAPLHSALIVLATVVAAVGWLGCAAGNGTAAADPPSAPPNAKSSTPSQEPSRRPAFEAGFDDASNVDPTPDGGDTCIDTDTAGSSENTAKALPDTTDAQNAPITVKGVLVTPVEVDYYKIKVADTVLHVLTADLKVATESTEMCTFVKCLTGATNFKGCTDGVAKTSDIGDKGCCTAGPGKANPNWSCGGTFQTDDSAQISFRIKETVGGKTCLPYSFSYAF